MLVGIEATLCVYDRDDKYVMVKDMRFSLKRMICLFICSIVCFMGVYISARIALLPLFTWSIIVSIIVGAIPCSIFLISIIWKSTRSQILGDYLLQFCRLIGKDYLLQFCRFIGKDYLL